MSSVFSSQDKNQENPQNPYLVVEQFSAQALIFSYRAVDFNNLFSFLQNQLGSPENQNFQSGRNGKKRGVGITNRTLMSKDLHEQQFQFFRNEFSMKFSMVPVNYKKNIVVNVTPDFIVGLNHVNEYIDNYYIAQDLKQYRPQRKPMTASMLKSFSKKTLKSDSFKRKRKNVVRDWFYFIVWYVRLKKILEQHKSATSLGTSPKLLLGIKGQDGSIVSKGINLKSPIQDPTQLTQMNFGFGMPQVQIKFFESNKKMQEFY